MSRNCETCIHGVFSQGDYSVGIPDSFDCNCEDAYEVVEHLVESNPRLWDEFTLPSICGWYEGITETSCPVCHKEYAAPRPQDTLIRVYGYAGAKYVCSHTCAAEFYAEDDAYLCYDESVRDTAKAVVQALKDYRKATDSL